MPQKPSPLRSETNASLAKPVASKRYALVQRLLLGESARYSPRNAVGLLGCLLFVLAAYFAVGGYADLVQDITHRTASPDPLSCDSRDSTYLRAEKRSPDENGRENPRAVTTVGAFEIEAMPTARFDHAVATMFLRSTIITAICGAQLYLLLLALFIALSRRFPASPWFDQLARRVALFSSLLWFPGLIGQHLQVDPLYWDCMHLHLPLDARDQASAYFSMVAVASLFALSEAMLRYERGNGPDTPD